jgi:hypothetical protein
VLWDATAIVNEPQKLIQHMSIHHDNEWFMNIIDLKSGRSTILSPSIRIQKWIARTLDITFTGDTGLADRLWLRKEIIKHDQEGQI